MGTALIFVQCWSGTASTELLSSIPMSDVTWTSRTIKKRDHPHACVWVYRNIQKREREPDAQIDNVYMSFTREKRVMSFNHALGTIETTIDHKEEVIKWL